MVLIETLTSNTFLFLLSLQSLSIFKQLKLILCLNISQLSPLPQLPPAGSAKLTTSNRIKEFVPESSDTKQKERDVAVVIDTAPVSIFFFFFLI